MGPVTSLRHLTGQRKRPCARSPFWNRSQRQPPARAGDTFQTAVVAIFARLIKRRCGSPRQQEIRAALARRGGVKVFSDRLCETAFPPSAGWRGSTRAIAAFTPPRAGTCRGERRLRNLMDLHGRDDSHHVPPAHIRLLAWVTVHAGRKAQGAITRTPAVSISPGQGQTTLTTSRLSEIT